MQAVTDRLGLCGFCKQTYVVVPGTPRTCCKPGRVFDEQTGGTYPPLPVLESLESEEGSCPALDASDAPNGSVPPIKPASVKRNASPDAPEPPSATSSTDQTTLELLRDLLTELRHLGGQIGGQVQAVHALAGAIATLAESISHAIDSGLVGDGDEPKLPSHDIEGNPIRYG